MNLDGRRPAGSRLIRSASIVAVCLAAPGCSGADPDRFVAHGTVEVREVDLAPLATGRVVRMVVEEGDTVAAGDTVAVLSAPTLDADIDVARSRVGSAEAALADLVAGPRPQELAAARAELAAARADSTRLIRDRDRVAALLDAGAVATREFDAAEAAARIAAERVHGAREAVALLEAGSRQQRIAVARGEVDAARATLAARQAVTAEFVLLSPSDGVVLSRVAEPGDIMAPGVPVAVVGEMGHPWVRIYVPARVLPRIAIGDVVAIYPPGAGGRSRSGSADDSGSGRIVSISTRAEYLTRVALTEEERADLIFGVRIALTEGWQRFRPGLPVTVHLALKSGPGQ